VPAEHSKHTVAASDGEYEPFVQFWHEDFAVPPWNVPATQSRQFTSPVSFAYLPASQLKHASSPGAFAYVPVAHSRHSACPF
jgi:hypothetical protein